MNHEFTESGSPSPTIHQTTPPPLKRNDEWYLDVVASLVLYLLDSRPQQRHHLCVRLVQKRHVHREYITEVGAGLKKFDVHISNEIRRSRNTRVILQYVKRNTTIKKFVIRESTYYNDTPCLEIGWEIKNLNRTNPIHQTLQCPLGDPVLRSDVTGLNHWSRDWNWSRHWLRRHILQGRSGRLKGRRLTYWWSRISSCTIWHSNHEPDYWSEILWTNTCQDSRHFIVSLCSALGKRRVR